MAATVNLVGPALRSAMVTAAEVFRALPMYAGTFRAFRAYCWRPRAFALAGLPASFPDAAGRAGLAPVTAAPSDEHRYAVIIDVRTADERKLFGAPPSAVHWPLAVVQRFRGEPPSPECETFSERDLTADERAEFSRWLMGHAVRQSELLFFCARGNRSLVAAHILHDLGYPQAYSAAGGKSAWQNAELPVASVEAGGRDRA